MKITPILTEKSLGLAKTGWYSFWVPVGFKKSKIKKIVGEAFKVHVKQVRTINYKKRTGKKALVTLAKGEKIEAFEAKKKK